MKNGIPLACCLVAWISACTSQMRVVVKRSDAPFDLVPKPVDYQVRVLEADEALS